VSDEIGLNGFQCFRLKDVTELEVPHEYRDFVEAALERRGLSRPERPDVCLSSIEELIVSAGALFDLITIHREDLDPDGCHIGKVVSVTPPFLHLQEITPAAIWETDPIKYRLSEITRVDFGGDYEDALWLVGGEPTGS
jgi:hypothetical protein